MFQLLLRSLLQKVVERTDGFLSIATRVPDLRERVESSPDMRAIKRLEDMVFANGDVPKTNNTLALEILAEMLTLIQAENKAMMACGDVPEGLRDSFISYGQTLSKAVTVLARFDEEM